ncbi:MAG: TldD/PmbA family protein [Bradymonadales bacterium]|nr:TldD/PmbA family protein [Bradymonadales bacterium]
MQRFCQEAISAALSDGADYADARIVESTYQTVELHPDRGPLMSQGGSLGLGVRARLVDSWGFAASSDPSLLNARRVGQRAVELARASGLIFPLPFRFAPLQPVQASWRTPVEIDPFSLPPEEKVSLLQETRHALRGAPVVREMIGQIHASRQVTTFANSEGSAIEQERTVVGAGYQALAVSSSGGAVRSYPQAYGGQFSTGGQERVNALRLVESAQHIRDEATRLLSAEPCPEGAYDLILAGPVVAMLLHETCGHLAELDRVLGTGWDLPTPSPVGLGDLGTLQFGSAQVTIDADATQPGALGTYGFDDEGVPARSVRLVDAGCWSGFLGDRRTTCRQPLEPFTGFARASGYSRPPLIRMANVNLQPGSWSLESLIADTHRGFYLDTPLAVTIDRNRRQFTCHCEIGWEIAAGRLERVVKAPQFQGQTVGFWRSCDAVCDAEHYTTWGFPACTKGDIPQLISSGHGAAPARFRGVRLGPNG